MRKIFGFLLVLCSLILNAAEKETPTLVIRKASGPITIDGKLDEPEWKDANVAGDFFQNFPFDSSYAITKTLVRAVFDDQNIYISAICFDDLPGEYVIQSLKRDFSYPVSDAFAVFIDPFNDKLNGFSFAVNPLGVQREGLLQGGGFFGVTTSWDNKWHSAVTRMSDKWIVEMAIPFKTIRFQENSQSWGINFSRNDLKRNENSSWAPVPRNFNIGSTAFTGTLIFESPPKKPGSNISLIPYTIGNANKDYSDNSEMNQAGNTGFDAKVAVSSSLNLDITINPDFSQVEVDRQIVNLTRFNLFFPEQRQFFIENSDLFSRFGFRQIRPFFSRNIGLHNGNVMPILAGARLSGKINKNLRIGLMNLQTEGMNIPLTSSTSEFVKSQNYTVAAFQQQIFGRSNIAAIFVNRQAFNGMEIDDIDYNRVMGIDYNIASENNRWLGKLFYHKSITPERNKDSYAHASWLMYNSEKMHAMWNHEYVGENYDAEVGFVPRNKLYNPDSGAYINRSYWRFEPMFGYKFYPESGNINNHGPNVYFSHYLDEGFKTTEYLFKLGYDIKMQSTSKFEFGLVENFTYLPFPTDITRTGSAKLISGNYWYRNFSFQYISNKRALAYFSLAFDFGTFFNGMKTTYNGSYSFRKQPWGIFSINITKDEITMPDPYENASLTLIGPKVELSFTKNIYFTTFIQYNTQIENVNLNTRFQWRFKPMSDFYIVYTENYLTPMYNVKNRALVLKFIYWLNL